jgi:hypothetical protein
MQEQRRIMMMERVMVVVGMHKGGLEEGEGEGAHPTSRGALHGRSRTRRQWVTTTGRTGRSRRWA